MGLAPSEFWGMHLWEYNLRVKIYNEMQEASAKLNFYTAHTTAALTSQGFAGKLKQASYYLPNEPAAATGKDLTDEEIAAIDRQLEERDKETNGI